MARGINKVILIGHIGGDPEVRYMPNGNAVATLSVATTEAWKDKQTGDKQERTEWHRVVCFNRLGEIAGEYVKKGSKLYVEGSLRTRKWQDPQGQDTSSQQPAYQQQTQASRPAQAARPAMSAPQEMLEELDDDIPF